MSHVQDELKQYDDSRKLSYEELKGNPAGIDLTKKEVLVVMVDLSCGEMCVCVQIYLTEEEFQKVFDITIHEFKGMPAWKRNDMKKKVGLF